MRFRLTYEGPLYATQGTPRAGKKRNKATHKQEIRKAMHAQLKEFWNTNAFLSKYQLRVRVPKSVKENPDSPGNKIVTAEHEEHRPMSQVFAERHSQFGYRFVPLVCKDFHLLCSLDVLFLRRDPPGGAVRAGDLDNRIKTLIDGLTMPAHESQLGDYVAPADDEDPFYCLLEDDNLVTQLSIETDRLLDPPGDDPAIVRLLITVDLKPYDATWDNINFI